MDACVLIAFYFETAEWLTATARLRTIRDALAHCSSWEALRDCTVEDRSVAVHFSDIWDAVNSRLNQLKAAREMVVEDPEILSGTPVIRGTRVPVYDVAAAVHRARRSIRFWLPTRASMHDRSNSLRSMRRRSLREADRSACFCLMRLRCRCRKPVYTTPL